MKYGWSGEHESRHPQSRPAHLAVAQPACQATTVALVCQRTWGTCASTAFLFMDFTPACSIQGNHFLLFLVTMPDGPKSNIPECHNALER